MDNINNNNHDNLNSDNLDASHFDSLSSNEIRYIAERLPLEAISRWCRTSQRFNREICNNENFWMRLVHQHFPDEVANINNYGTVDIHHSSIPTTEKLPMLREYAGADKVRYHEYSIDFTSWKEYYGFLHIKCDVIRKNKQIDLALDILRHSSYESASPIKQIKIEKRLFANGLDPDRLKLIKHVEFMGRAPNHLSYYSFMWNGHYVTLNHRLVLQYPISRY